MTVCAADERALGLALGRTGTAVRRRLQIGAMEMSEAPIRQRLAAGERAFGTMVFEFFTPGLASVLRGAGCEWVVLDTEHSGVGIETIKQQISYARGLDIAVWVRVPEKSYAAVATALDAGAQGIMVPMLETVEQAQDLVRWARYRPEGERGCAFGVAHDDYGATDPLTKIREANDQIVLIPLLETRGAIERCEDIMAVPGIDIGWLGHYDLTNDMGITAQFEDPRFIEAAERVARACAASGKTAATLDANPALLQAQMARGYRVIGFGTDVVAMRNGYAQGFAAVRES